MAEKNKVKQYNNASKKFADWDDEFLKNEFLNYDDMIHGKNPCYGTRDVRKLYGIMAELDKREIEIGNLQPLKTYLIQTSCTTGWKYKVKATDADEATEKFWDGEYFDEHEDWHGDTNEEIEDIEEV